MSRVSLLDLNVPHLFEERTIEDIIHIDKLLDAEIERKRMELRSMVGDRYKDILTATEAIKSMEYISENIVGNIINVKDQCETLVQNISGDLPKKALVTSNEKNEERTIVMQIRLAIVLNENIWLALDEDDFSKAAQYYLLAQHVHTGLRLFRKDIFEKYKVIKKIKSTVDSLRERILSFTYKKLQTIQLSAEDTCSNLNALMLLENHKCSELLCKFIKLRKNALTTVIEATHSSVRAQVSAMVKCLYTTIILLHDCFLNYKDTHKGLIWHQLDGIVGDNSPTTLSTVQLPETNLLQYIPDIIKQFRPKCSNANSTLTKEEGVNLIQEWIKDTSNKVKVGIENALDMVPNVKGLHIIREEALKIELPPNWDEICLYTELPSKLNIWYQFFQKFITNRALFLITKKITYIMQNTQNELSAALNAKENCENDLRWYIWKEDQGDISQFENKHLGLSMKTKGYSPSVVRLCEDFDKKFRELLEDISVYIYGIEFDKNRDFSLGFAFKDPKNNRKFVDREKLEEHLKSECGIHIKSLISFLESVIQSNEDQSNILMQSILSARLLSALTNLCENFKKCCCCNNNADEWDKIGAALNSSALTFWQNWIDDSVNATKVKAKELLEDVDPLKMLSILCTWDSIEIQEQTDEKIFKSQIKVPMKPSLALQKLLNGLNEMLNAILPHTVPKKIHLSFIEGNVSVILDQYAEVLQMDLNQTQALQFLFDVKFLTTFSIPRENLELGQKSQSICEKCRSFVDPFDLDVFYKYLQHNVKQSVLQSQVIFGSLLPTSGQLSSLGMLEKSKDNEREPSVLGLSIPSTTNWFTLLPVTAPLQKTVQPAIQQTESKVSKVKSNTRKPNDAATGVRSAAALFGAMTTDWFS